MGNPFQEFGVVLAAANPIFDPDNRRLDQILWKLIAERSLAVNAGFTELHFGNKVPEISTALRTSMASPNHGNLAHPTSSRRKISFISSLFCSTQTGSCVTFPENKNAV